MSAEVEISSGKMARQLVIFDLDGTITRADTLIPFLSGCVIRFPRRLRACLFALPFETVRFALGRITAGTFKETLLRAIIGGLPAEDVNRWAETYASRVVASGCRASTLKLIKEHQDRGDRLILLSASPGLYVRLIGRALGISETVATEVEIKDGRYTGALITPNCAGHEKLRRIREYLGSDKYSGKTLAFGDRESDRPLLEWADEGWLVSGEGLRPVRSVSVMPSGQAHGAAIILTLVSLFLRQGRMPGF